MLFRPTLLSACALISLSACQTNPAALHASNKVSPLLVTYADMATEAYGAALLDAEQLQQVIAEFSDHPDDDGLQKAKNAWLASRESYGLTEVFRLTNGPIDAEQGWVADAYRALEGQINAWPLDENLIDYTIDAEGRQTSGNIIDSSGLFKPGGVDASNFDVSQITAELLGQLNENGGDANVASGYHAIEFLLWGQDQDYASFSRDSISNGALTAGQRPLSDFTTAAHADRRLQYLRAASSKLVADLGRVNLAWNRQFSSDCESDARGCYRAALLQQLEGSDSSKNIDEKTALRQIISGMGVFIKSELANERIAVAVLTPSEEDEHSCFSDNTHRDISLNYQGFVDLLKGSRNAAAVQHLAKPAPGWMN